MASSRFFNLLMALTMLVKSTVLSVESANSETIFQGSEFLISHGIDELHESCKDPLDKRFPLPLGFPKSTAIEITNSAIVVDEEDDFEAVDEDSTCQLDNTAPLPNTDLSIVEFVADKHRWILELQVQDDLITDHTIIQTHHRSSTSTASTMGKAYIGIRLVVIDLEKACKYYSNSEDDSEDSFNSWSSTKADESKTNSALSDCYYYKLSAARVLKKTQKSMIGVASISKTPFGRFFIEPSSGLLSGSFVYQDHFISLDNFVLKPGKDSRHRRVSSRFFKPRDPTAPPSSNLTVKIQDLKHVGKSSHLQCGTNNLQFNRDPTGALSHIASRILEHETKLIDPIPFMDASSVLASNNPLLAHARRANNGSKKPRSDANFAGFVMLIGVVADCSYVQHYQGDVAAIRSRIVSDFNLASSIFEEAFDIRLGIISIDLMMECAQPKDDGRIAGTELWNLPCSRRLDMNSRLNSFTTWRASQPQSAGIYHLLTACNDGTISGLAWIGQVCRSRPFVEAKGQHVAGTSVTSIVDYHFSVIAHELAHNFGAIHDCTDAACTSMSSSSIDASRIGRNHQVVDGFKLQANVEHASGDKDCCKCTSSPDRRSCGNNYIMSPHSASRNLREFSPCTLAELRRKMPILASQCLVPPHSHSILEENICGNGIREGNEECDCGDEESCAKSKCCLPNCKLKPNAQCADENDGCCRECQIIPKADKVICYKSQSVCHESSICDGVNRDCPLPVSLPDGTPCQAILWSQEDDQLGQSLNTNVFGFAKLPIHMYKQPTWPFGQQDPSSHQGILGQAHRIPIDQMQDTGNGSVRITGQKMTPDPLKTQQIQTMDQKHHYVSAACAKGICTSRQLQCLAVGARRGLTEACTDEIVNTITNPCSITCQRPGSTQCEILDAALVDGTPCGVHGRCYAGKCSESMVVTIVKSNVVAIGLILGAFLFVALLALSRFIFRFRRRTQ